MEIIYSLFYKYLFTFCADLLPRLDLNCFVFYIMIIIISIICIAIQCLNCFPIFYLECKYKAIVKLFSTKTLTDCTFLWN